MYILYIHTIRIIIYLFFTFNYWLKNKICFRCLFLMVFCKLVWALRGFENTMQGLCTESVQVTKSRVVYQNVYKTYEYTKRCGFLHLKKCKRTGGNWVNEATVEWYPDYELNTVCCEGYEKENEECRPTCNPHCEYSYCSAVNHCTCYGGYNKNTSNICVPVCRIPCQNGICSAPETCTCLTGYIKDNQNSSVCNPFCSQECKHGICISPETCFCDPGYQIDPRNNYTCIPVCSEGCQNGVCVGPEMCACLDGYERDSSNSSVCHPVCSKTCVNSKCSAPDLCTCFDGFVKNKDHSNMCDPYCSKQCKNGFCSSPEECMCYSGFNKRNNSSHECEPICSKECINSVCSKPETCSCFVGYQIDSFDKYTCEPVCSRECKNSKCRAPETCICNQGYVYDQQDSYLCIPHCAEGCVNSNCTAPGICECHEGYEKIDNHQNVCKPVCSKCINADCVKPEICKCWEGYETFTEDHCVPICSSCQFGNCDYPEMCGCWAGYGNPPDSNATCIPVCDKECVNSLCTSPNKCTCLEGFNNKTGVWNECSPRCSKECLNGVCVNPEECECLPGFQLDEYDPYSCLPSCSDGCTNGLCTAPEYCSCFWGFQPSENSSTCSDTSKTYCLFNWEFLFNSSPEEQCLDLIIRSQREYEIIRCPFIDVMFTKFFTEYGYQKVLSVEFQCSVSSTIYDSDLLIICVTDEVTVNNPEEILDDDITSNPTIPQNDTNYVSQFTDSIEIPFVNMTSSTLAATEQSVTEVSDLSHRTPEITYFEHIMNHDWVESKNLYSQYSDIDVDPGEYSQTTIVIDDNSSSFSSNFWTSNTESSTYISTSLIYDETNQQIQSTESYGEYEKNITRNITVKIKLDHYPYIKNHGILVHYFDDVTEVQLPTDLCICSHQINRSSCEGEFRFRLYTCQCNNSLHTHSTAGSVYGLPALSISLIVLMLTVTILAIGSFLHFKNSKQPADKFMDELERELKKVRVLIEDTRAKNIDEDRDENLTTAL